MEERKILIRFADGAIYRVKGEKIHADSNTGEIVILDSDSSVVAILPPANVSFVGYPEIILDEDAAEDEVDELVEF